MAITSTEPAQVPALSGGGRCLQAAREPGTHGQGDTSTTHSSAMPRVPVGECSIGHHTKDNVPQVSPLGRHWAQDMGAVSAACRQLVALCSGGVDTWPGGGRTLGGLSVSTEG